MKSINTHTYTHTHTAGKAYLWSQVQRTEKRLGQTLLAGSWIKVCLSAWRVWPMVTDARWKFTTTASEAWEHESILTYHVTCNMYISYFTIQIKITCIIQTKLLTDLQWDGKINVSQLHIIICRCKSVQSGRMHVSNTSKQNKLGLRLECSLDSLSIDPAHVIYVAEGHNVGSERQSSVMTLRKPIVTWYVKTFQKRQLRVLNPARINVFYWFNWLNLIGS